MTKTVNTSKIFNHSLSDYDYVTSVSSDIFTSGNITLGSSDTSYTWATGTTGISATGASPYTWTTGTNGIDWSIGSNIQPNSGKVSIIGPNADIEVNGRSLMGAIDALEQRLNILVPNPELEKEWDELKQLGDRYRELEKQCKEKGEMWKKLKQMPPEQS